MNGNPNPITQFAQKGSFELVYPSHHPMFRWDTKKSKFSKLGRFGDTVDFANLDTVVQTAEMAAAVGSVGTQTELVETCGSPGHTTPLSSTLGSITSPSPCPCSLSLPLYQFSTSCTFT